MEETLGQPYRLEDYLPLGMFLHEEPAAVIAVPIDDAGSLHAAPLLYYHTEQPFKFYFVTSKLSEKCTLLRQKPSIQAACVVGTYAHTSMMLQMRGTLAITEPSQELMESYYKKRGNRNDDIRDPDSVCLVFTPAWARFTDYEHGYDQHRLLLPETNDTA